MAINDLGHRAISLTGSQAGIVTDTSHTKARILDVRADRIREALDEDLIVLVAGFQGVSTARDVTTLGRGGSDTTAVALAAAIDAEVCEIYTDVAGVFSADPRIVPDARKLPVVSFEEMLEMSASGAGVLQLRSVEYARNHGVRIHCRSSFTEAPGTFVVGEEETMERPLITAVTHSRDEARITLLGVPDHPGVAGRIFTALADANINVDMIIQDEPASEGAEAHMSFTVPRSDLRDARAALDPVAAEVGITRRPRRPRDGQGLGRRRRHEVRTPASPRKVFATLGDQGINIEMISTSPIKISCVVTADSVDRAVRALHEAFELGADQIEAEHPFGAPGMSQYRVAVVGATGAVGTVMRAKLRERGFPAAEIVPFASERSAGPRARRRALPRALRRDDPGLRHRAVQRGRDHVARVGAEVRRGRRGRRRQLVARSARDPEIPLVVSEVNPEALEGHKGLIANPNCSTMQLMVALKPIYDAAGIDRLIVSTYQSVSGTGVKAVKELEDQTRAALAGEPLPDADDLPAPHRVQRARRRRQLRRRRRPHRRRAQDDVRDAQDPRRRGIRIAVTCARVPVRNSHSESVSLETREDLSRRGAPASCWRTCPGSILVDDPAHARLPDGARRRRPRRGLRRPPAPRSDAPARPADVGRQRQPAQGRGHQRRPDRRGPARAWAGAGSGCRLSGYHICQATDLPQDGRGTT